MIGARRLERVFGIEIETCPACGGFVRISSMNTSTVDAFLPSRQGSRSIRRVESSVGRSASAGGAQRNCPMGCCRFWSDGDGRVIVGSRQEKPAEANHAPPAHRAETTDRVG